MLCVGEGPLLVNPFPKCKKYGSCKQGMNINISWDMGDSIPYLAPTQFQELIFAAHNPSKNTGVGILNGLWG
jgi:hypothetical protein